MRHSRPRADARTNDRLALFFVACWTAGLFGCGKNGLGTNEGTGTDSPSIVGGAEHTCLLANRGILCWGDNTNGELGINSTDDGYLPAAVQGLPNGVQAVAAGAYHTCALSNGRVWCWGDNQSGGLGDNSTTDRLLPVAVQGLPGGVEAITAGSYHTCALVNGGVQCWGSNSYGQLGDNSTTDRHMPVSVQGLSTGVGAISAGGEHTCALVNGGVQCWGWNGLDQADGLPHPESINLVPTAVEGLSTGVQSMTAGSYHTCVTVNGGAQCWGWNYDGQLGDGSMTGSLVPVPVRGLSSGVQAISAGWDFTCALVNGGVQCWGYTREIGIGDTNWAHDTFVPTAVVGLTTSVGAIGSGDEHTCALVNGGLQCWGSNNHGELGNESNSWGLIPVSVHGVVGL
jgi:alpha-tubulin suppressor-like RCC1 family protein